MRTIIRNRLAASLLLGAVMAGLMVTPVLASARYQPDGLVRVAMGPFTVRGPWLGTHIYNATGAHQAAILRQRATVAGAYFMFDVSIQNTGKRTDRFTVKATGAADGWTVTYSRGGTNITRSVVAGTFETPSLAPGASYGFSARINAGGGRTLSVYRLVTIRSAADPARLDAVKFGLRW